MPAQPTLDVTRAIQFGQLVNATYATPPGDLANKAGQALSAGGVDYTVVTTIYANDLATDMNPGRVDDDVSIGLICQERKTGDVAIAIRGTEGTLEWIHDADFLQVPCPFLAGAVHTEDGFTEMYESLRTAAAPDGATVVTAFAKLPFPQPVGSVTICGHSLGGALATLLALDMAANTTFTDPAVYTYASPRTGDSLFASTYDQVVKNSYRVANRLDVVPALPPPLGYEHVLTRYDLNPIRLVPLPPKVLVKYSLLCEHSLATYLYLLSLQSGGPVLPLEPACKP
jgi:Lipase (class 3)